jgi:hypothetical protein
MFASSDCPDQKGETMPSPFKPGVIIILTLREPRAKVWGMLLHLDETGVALRGLDLSSFDDWLREQAKDEEAEIRASLSFYPLSRVERILIDEPAIGVPSLDAQCRARTGRSMHELLQEEDSGEANLMVEGS